VNTNDINSTARIHPDLTKINDDGHYEENRDMKKQIAEMNEKAANMEKEIAALKKAAEENQNKWTKLEGVVQKFEQLNAMFEKNLPI